MAGPGICVLCWVDTCAFEVHPVFNPVAPYGYLFPNMYLFIADIANPDLFDVVGPGLVSPAFVMSSQSHPANPHGRLAKKSSLHCWGRGFNTICTSVCDRCDSHTACRLCRLEP